MGISTGLPRSFPARGKRVRVAPVPIRLAPRTARAEPTVSPAPAAPQPAHRRWTARFPQGLRCLRSRPRSRTRAPREAACAENTCLCPALSGMPGAVIQVKARMDPHGCGRSADRDILPLTPVISTPDRHSAKGEPGHKIHSRCQRTRHDRVVHSEANIPAGIHIINA